MGVGPPGGRRARDPSPTLDGIDLNAAGPLVGRKDLTSRSWISKVGGGLAQRGQVQAGRGNPGGNPSEVIGNLEG